jgi:hypothetical protein
MTAAFSIERDQPLAVLASPHPAAARPIAATPYRWRDPAAIPRRAWIFRRHYIRRFVTTTVAPGGVGKTTLALAEAIAMATGRDFLGEPPSGQMRVWYWNGEDPKEEIERRIAAICQLHQIDADRELTGRLFIDSGHDAPIKLAAMGPGAKVIFDEQAVSAIVKEVQDNRIDVMILDPFISCHAVSENDNVVIDQVVKKFAQIAALTNSAIEFLHHVRKPGPRQGPLTTDDSRGGGAIVNACRSARVLNRMTEEEAAAAGVESSKRRSYFRVDKDKANMAPPEVAVWARLVAETLPNGDSVAAVEAWSYPAAFTGITTNDMEHVRGVARVGSYRIDPRSPEWIGAVLAERLGLSLEEKTHCARISKIIKTWVAAGALAIEERIDPKTRKTRKFVVPGTWKKAAGEPADREENDDAPVN